MESKKNRATFLRPEGERVIDAPLVPIDLAEFTKIIRTEKAWTESDRNAITVFKTDDLRLVLIALHKGVEMPRHTAAGVISVQVLEGHIAFETDTEAVELTPGQMLALHAGEAHRVEALEESVFLLTMGEKKT